MERQRQPYLEELEELRDMIREVENLEFHHCAPGTPERLHYDRLVELEVKLDGQVKRHPQYPPSVRAAAQIPLGRPSERGVRDSSGGSDVDSGSPGGYRSDPASRVDSREDVI